MANHREEIDRLSTQLRELIEAGYMTWQWQDMRHWVEPLRAGGEWNRFERGQSGEPDAGLVVVRTESVFRAISNQVATHLPEYKDRVPCVDWSQPASEEQIQRWIKNLQKLMADLRSVTFRIGGELAALREDDDDSKARRSLFGDDALEDMLGVEGEPKPGGPTEQDIKRFWEGLDRLDS